MQIHILIFHCPPQPFDKNIVQCPSAPVHADGNAVVEQHPREAVTGELRALVGIEHFRHTVGLDGFFQAIHTEPGIYRVRRPPTQYLAAIPIDNGDQVDKAVQQPDVGDVGAPDLVGADDLDTPEQNKGKPCAADAACWCWARATCLPSPVFASSAAPACGSRHTHNHINRGSCAESRKRGAGCILRPRVTTKYTQDRRLLPDGALFVRRRPNGSLQATDIAYTPSVRRLSLSNFGVVLWVEPRLFFKPVQFHVELPDLGVQPIWVTLGIDRLRAALAFKQATRILQ